MYGLSESRKVSDAQRKHCRGYSKFTLPYREPNGSLLEFQNGIMKHCILYPQHIHMDNNISSNGYMRGRYFKTILILIVMYMQVMQAMLILAKSITGHIRFMISGDPSYGKAEYKHMFSIWVCVSIFHNNDYGSSRRSSHTKHSDTRKEFAHEAQTFWYYRTCVCSYRRTTCRRNDESSTISYLSGYLSQQLSVLL